MRIGITIGDPAGIGPEIVLKTFEYLAQFKSFKRHQFIVTGNMDAFFLTGGNNCENRLKSAVRDLNIRFAPVDCKLPETYAQPSAEGGLYSVEAIKKIYELYLNGEIDAVATAPIDKKSIKLADIKEVDHTQIFKKLSRVPFVDTLFKTKNMHIYFYSKHIPFSDIASAINQNDLYDCILRCLKYDNWLGLNRNNLPLAVAALNPHAGDGNRFGDEETRIIKPVVLRSQKEGKNVTGPIPADSVFALANEGAFSSVLSLYHDQGHIAAKTLDFYRTVSFSPGMPFLRTSVDHGTAMNIAGKNKASAVSMIYAIKAAIKYGRIYGRNFKKNEG